MASGTGVSFEEVRVGQTLGPRQVLISKERNRRFALSSGMDAPRFTDDAGARAEGLPGMITPGNFSLSLLLKLVTDWLGTGPGQVSRIGTTYRAIVLPERPLILQGFVTHIEPAARSIDIDVWIENDEGERPVFGTITARFA